MDFDKLDDAQRTAVVSDSRNTMVIAAPGAGKTTVLLYRAAYLINELRVPHDDIAVITFTKAAAENMKQRYAALMKEKKLPYISTFHSLFYAILSKTRNIKIIDESTSISIIRSTLNKFIGDERNDRIREILNSIIKYKISLYAGINYDEYKPCIDMSILKKCYEDYEQYKASNLLMDFEDLQLECLKLLDKEKINSTYCGNFRHILVDEFQDCDSLEICFLQKLGSTASIFAVGDEDQSIYGFRDSRPDCMVDFSKYFIDGKKVFLSRNYRCPCNITELSGELIKNNKERNMKKLCSYRKDDGGIYVYVCENSYSETVKIIFMIKDMIKSKGYEFHDFAVLYRTNIESRQLMDNMFIDRIPFVIRGNIYNFYNHFLCRDIIDYFKLSVDFTNEICFSNIINKPLRYISKLYVEKLKKYAFKTDCFEYLLTKERLNIHQKKQIYLMKKQIKKLRKMSPCNAYEYILDDIGYEKYIIEWAKAKSMDEEELRTIIDELSLALKQFSSITEVLTHIECISSEIESSFKDQGVILSTIHGAKGAEFKNVMILNCNEGIIPYIHNNCLSSIEEERRLFYVAVTRTIDNLFIFIPKRYNNIERESSRFIEESSILLNYLE